MAEHPFRVVVVGAGPRGISVLDRLATRAAGTGGRPIAITVVDPFPPAGRIWRRDQSPELLMNTLARESTVFADASHTGFDGHGPDLWTWTRTATDLSPAEQAAADALGPHDYAPRFLFGAYLEHAFAAVVARLPEVEHVRDSVTDVLPGSVRLAGGREITADAVVLTTGHTTVRPTPQEQALLAHAAATGAVYGPPAHPTETPAGAVPAGVDVLVRGMALNFFDVVAMLTTGRGGRFTRDGDGTLRYVPSGAEPVLHAGSRRGIAQYSRVDRPGIVAPVRFLDDRLVAALLRRAPDVDLHRDVWPAVLKEATWAYYARLAETAPEVLAIDPAAFLAEFREAHPGTPAWTAMLHRAVPDTALHLDLEAAARPLTGLSFGGPDELTAWMIEHLDRDFRQADDPSCTPRAAATAALRGTRRRLSPLMVAGGLSGRSYARDVTGWFGALMRTLSNGPPRRRTEELAALARAGVVRFLGAGTEVEPDGDGFTATSSSLPGHRVHARHLLDAFVPVQDVRRSADPLWTSLLASGRARTYRRPDPSGPGTELGAVDVHPVTSETAPGSHHYVLGVLTEGSRWNTALVSRVGTCSRFVIDTDATAAALVAQAARPDIGGTRG